MGLVVIGLGLVALPYGADAVGLAAGSTSEGGCRVVRVIDGDTVTLWCPDTGFERTRLLGFDTPEKYAPDCAQEFTAALRAEWALRRAVLMADRLTVRLGSLDRYDRRLARLILDGRDVADILISEGHARAYSGGRRQGWCA